MGLNFRIFDSFRGAGLKIAARSTSPVLRRARRHPVIAISRSGNVTRMALRQGRQIIGGGAQCDIVALGMSAGQAFAIDVSPAPSGQPARLDVLRKGVEFQNRMIPEGQVGPLADGQVVRVDGIEFWLEGVGGASTRFKGRHVAAACLLAVSSLLLVAGLGADAGDATQAREQNLSQSTGTTPPAILIHELREALRMSGLAVGVNWNEKAAAIDVGEQGQPLPVAAKNQLSNIMDVFARRSETPLRDRTRLTSGVEHLVASVALEPVKFIVGKDGKRYREGDAIGGDWTVESISNGVITVARGGERDDFSLSSPSGSSALKLASNGAGNTR